MSPMRRSITATLFLFLVCRSAYAMTSTSRPTPPQSAAEQDARQGFDRGLTALIHYGLAATIDGADSSASIAPAPNVHQWITVLSEGGFDRAILTVKRSDGWCLWPSTTTERSTRSIGATDDTIASLARACASAQLSFGISFSLVDRSHADPSTYDQVVKAQLREVCTTYGPLAEILFEGLDDPDRPACDWPGIVRLVRELQPAAALTCLRGDNIVNIDVESPNRPGTPSGKALSLRPNWFWRQSENEHVKRLEKLEEAWYETVGRGQRLVLGVPPDSRGLIPDPDRMRLAELRALFDATFSADLCAGAPVSAQRQGERDRYEIPLGAGQAINRIEVIVDAPVADLRFDLEASTGTGSPLLAIVTNEKLDRRRILRFPTVVVDSLRLTARAAGPSAPTIAVRAYCAPPEVRIDSPSGAFTGTAILTMSADVPGSEIRYTLDGQTPTQQSMAYTEPITLSHSVRIRALAFRGAQQSSRVATRDLIRFDESLFKPAIQFVRAPDPGLRLRRFDGHFRSLDELRAATAVEERVVESFALPTGRPKELYGLIYEGFIEVPSDGVYAFTMRSDDASRLFVHNSPVIDHGDGASWEWWQGRIPLRAGWHPIRVEFVQQKGEDRLQVRWSGPGIEEENVLAARLAH
jgi:Alpha-L-fucosidase/Chitobiase/beta-hexosaminidase C-terminal domain/PA14 domain